MNIKIISVVLLIFAITILFSYFSLTGYFLYKESITPINISGNISLEYIQKKDNQYAELYFENETSFILDFPVSENRTYNLTLITNFSEKIYLKIIHNNIEIYNSELESELKIPINLTEGLQKFNFTFYKKRPEKGLPITGFFAAMGREEVEEVEEPQKEEEIIKELEKLEEQEETVSQVKEIEKLEEEIKKMEPPKEEPKEEYIETETEKILEEKVKIEKPVEEEIENKTLIEEISPKKLENETIETFPRIIPEINKTTPEKNESVAENETTQINETITLPTNETNITIPTNETNLTQPLNETNITLLINETNITTPVNETNITIPTNETNFTHPVNNTNITVPFNETNVTVPVNETNITIPINETNITIPANETFPELNITDLPPSIKINSPLQNEVLWSKLIIINLTAIDNNLNYTNISILQEENLINSTLNYEKGTFLITLSVPKYGNYTIVATSYDLSGNKNSTTVPIKVRRKPTLKIDFIGLIPIIEEVVQNQTNITTQILISLNTDKLTYKPKEIIAIVGHASLLPSGTPIVGNELFVYLDENLDAILITNPNGNYNYILRAPAEIGTHIIKVNLTMDGIYGENETTIKVIDNETNLTNITKNNVYFISSCSILDKKGATYYLTRDIIDSKSEICFDIIAEDITLDCQGHKIDGTFSISNLTLGLGAPVGIPPPNITNITMPTNIGIRTAGEFDRNGKRATIKNCVLTDWDHGIKLLAARNTLENIILSSNSEGIGVYSLFNKIENAKVNSNNYGISFHSVYGNKLLNSELKDNNLYDFYIEAGNSEKECDNELVNIKGTDNKEIAYYDSKVELQDDKFSELVLCNADDSTLKNIKIEHKKKKNNGILLIRTNRAKLSNINVVNSNVGIYLDKSFNNKITNSKFDNNLVGISPTSEFEIEENEIRDNIFTRNLQAIRNFTVPMVGR